MFLAVELLVNRGVLDSKIGAQINHAQPGSDERPRKFRGHAVRQREEDETRAARDDRVHVRLDEKQRRVALSGELGKDGIQPLACKLARSDRRETDAGMPDEQPHELFARVAARADDGDILKLHGGGL